MSIGENIKKYRNLKGLTQKQLAEATNLSRSYIGNLEIDRYNPSANIIALIAGVLGVTSSDIMGESTSDLPALKLIQNLIDQFYNSPGTTVSEKDALFKYITDLYWKTKEKNK